MASQSKEQKETMERVMHESGASKYESKEENKRNLERTKERER